jgi:CHAT domain-containing protein
VLVFHVGAEDAWAWLIDAHSVRMARLPPAGRVAGVVRTAFSLASVAEPDLTAVNDALRSLSEVLLDPLPPDGAKPRLVIVPDGILHLVPFAALPYAAQGGEPLLASFALTYSPAVTLLENLAQRPAPALASLAVFAAPEVGDSANISALRGQLRDYSGDLAEILASFGPLPFSKVEAREMKRLAGARKVEVYEGAAANRDAVTKRAPRGYELLHFATHALASSDFPDLAGLVLSGRDTRGEPAPDLLHLREIYGLDLDADLVVLSACRTALGRAVRGEGPMSLGRAFLYAGADRVITTQWAAADDVAAELMTHFYDGLFTRGLAPADALRAAQLAVRDSPDWRHPFYWAGLTLTSLSTN